MNDYVNIFDGHIPYYKITKPVRLIELFAGIGSQHQALKNLGVKIDRSTIVEWQVNSIQAYNDIHVRKYDDWTKDMTKEELAHRLNELGVSLDYNQPAKLETLLRKGEDWLRNVYNNIINTNNKVNIMSVKASHLNITDTDKYDYILTYSFPCQDLSKAGKGKGMSDTTTRSGLLWEVERILSECEELPQVLLMENVPDVIGSRYISDFKRWDERLRELGYSNHIEVLNAKDYGIPQNRERAFMVSILGSSLYNFPQKQPLKLRLKDMLEKEVDEKYYLSDKVLSKFSEINENNIKILEDTKTGYSYANEGDGVYVDRPQQKRGVVQKQMIQTIKAYNDDIGVVVRLGNYSLSNHNASSIVDINGIAPTVMENHGTITAVADSNDVGVVIIDNIRNNGTSQSGNVYDKEQLSPTLCATDYKNPPKVVNQLRIRKLTPRECYRLMGFGDEAFNLAQPNQSNSSLYHQAGDSIVVNVLMAIFKELL